MSRREKSEELESNLEPLRNRLESWRESCNQKRRRIPEELWSDLVEAASKYGVAVVSKRLRVDYSSLKSRLEEAFPAVKSVDKAAKFIEISPPLARKSCANAIELQKSGGSKIRIEFEGALSKELSSLSERLWRAAR
jgi:hypothetical protein